MTDIFDFDKKSTLFAVMGNPVAHSKSPRIHHLFAEQFGICIDYQRIQVDVGGFPQALSNFQASGGRGLNITVPFKVEACNCADELGERARLAGAANTIWFSKHKVHADNTDGVGLLRDLRNNLGYPLRDKKVLILGAGGAVRGVLGPLLQDQSRQITVANRTVDKAKALSELFAGAIHGCGFAELDRQQFDIVINGTAGSLSGDLPPLPKNLFSPNALAYDMVYLDQPTVFMQWAQQHGAAKTSDGLGMLVEQAAESFYIWHEKRPDVPPVIKALRQTEHEG